MLYCRPFTQAGFIAALTGPKARRRRSSSASKPSAGVTFRICRPPAVTGSPELLHDSRGNEVVRVDVLHVVGVLERLDQAEHLARVVLVQLDLDRGQERAL